MSEEQQNTENEANVDLKGVIKDLAEQIDILNKHLGKFSQGMAQGSKDFHKTHGEKLDEIRAQGKMVQENLKFRKSLQESQTSMQLFTGMMKKGVTPMLVMNAIGNKLGGVTQEFDDMKEKQKAYSDFMSKNMTKDLSKDVNRPLLEEKKELLASKQEAEGTYEKKKGGKGQQMLTEGLSKMGKFADKHAQGMIIGAGSAIILIQILKKALSASPMFQQMMKLLNFGIMMVLRPIGDFFGFLFRPILIMLLRKFIIPWYTKMYPFMMKMGDLIGNKLSGAFEALATGDVVGAFAILFEGVDFKKILGDAFAGIHTWIEETDWDKVWDDLVAGLLAFGTGIWDYIIKPIGEAIYEELSKVNWGAAIWDTIKAVLPVFAVADFIAGMFGIGNNKWFNEWGRAVGDWIRDGFKNATVSFTTFFEEIKQEILKKMGLGFLIDDKKSETDKEPSIFGTSNYTPTTGGSPRMHGGLIEEPIMGIGRSGRRYMFGEAGTEVVTPMNEISGSGSITINIQNMSGTQQDLNNLRQVILDVVQESSARRGRA